MYVTPAGALAKNGSNWANAMGYAEWEADVEGSAEAGDIYYVAGGTYTLTSDFTTTLDGTDAAPIKIIGVKSTTTNEPPIASDWATGTDRPLITDGASAYTFTFDTYWQIRNIRGTTSDTDGIKAVGGSILENVSWVNDGAATRDAIDCHRAINCESVSTNGRAINNSVAGGIITGCYVHDSATGIILYLTNFATFNIADTCTTGIALTDGQHNCSITNNTIYNSTTGIDGGTAVRNTILNNIISDCATGIAFDSEDPSNWSDYNDIFNTSVADRSNVMVGEHDVDVDPGFGGAAGGDFSITGAI
jgi:parallel beta-helix repeat protein